MWECIKEINIKYYIHMCDIILWKNLTVWKIYALKNIFFGNLSRFFLAENEKYQYWKYIL